MLLFLLDIAAYLLTLVASFAFAGSTLFRLSEAFSPTAQSLIVVLAAPVACWGLGFIHWHAYAFAKVLLIRAGSVVSQGAEWMDREISEQISRSTETFQAIFIAPQRRYQPVLITQRKATRRNHDYAFDP